MKGRTKRRRRKKTLCASLTTLFSLHYTHWSATMKNETFFFLASPNRSSLCLIDFRLSFFLFFLESLGLMIRNPGAVGLFPRVKRILTGQGFSHTPHLVERGRKTTK